MTRFYFRKFEKKERAFSQNCEKEGEHDMSKFYKNKMSNGGTFLADF
jgi:hypothetical protein